MVLNKGHQMYHGKFDQLIKAINPKRRMLFEFQKSPNKVIIDKLKFDFSFIITDNILTAELPENNLKDLLILLLKDFQPQRMSFEDLPVEETMRSFFTNPNKYLK